MTRFAFLIIFLAAFIFSCSDKTSIASQSRFESFEISYTNGWAKSFAFIVDSNRIYISPQSWDTAYYGIVPDTIFKMLYTTFLIIRGNENIKSKDKGCVDCSVIAIKIISNGDTTRIRQTGDLDNSFHPLIRTLQTFIDSSKHQTIQAVVFLETRSIVTPLPPPKIEATKFKPPITTSGR